MQEAETTFKWMLFHIWNLYLSRQAAASAILALGFGYHVNPQFVINV